MDNLDAFVTKIKWKKEITEGNKNNKMLLERITGMTDIDVGIIITSNKDGLKMSHSGDLMKVYGMLDFLRRQLWMRLSYPKERYGSSYIDDISDEIEKNIAKDITEEMDKEIFGESDET